MKEWSSSAAKEWRAGTTKMDSVLEFIEGKVGELVDALGESLGLVSVVLVDFINVGGENVQSADEFSTILDVDLELDDVFVEKLFVVLFQEEVRYHINKSNW